MTWPWCVPPESNGPVATQEGMKEILLAFVLVGLVCNPAFALADEPAPETSVHFKKVTLVEFGQLEVSGQLVRPEATLVQARRQTRFTTLIRHRGDFRPELLRSLDNL